jgi:hypothetical protein
MLAGSRTVLTAYGARSLAVLSHMHFTHRGGKDCDIDIDVCVRLARRVETDMSGLPDANFEATTSSTV